ncbi:hypothetical protein JCM3766R1_003264 [Sporobolomyces carnicolor]
MAVQSCCTRSEIVQSLKVPEAPAQGAFYHGRIHPNAFVHVIEQERHARQQMVTEIEAYRAQLEQDQVLVNSIKSRLENRSKASQHTKKLIAKSGKAAVYERRELLIEQQRKLLEQLMGPEALGIVQNDVSLYDPKLCHPFVAGICPHDLFTNTKMDLGPCPKNHSQKLKQEYLDLYKKSEAAGDEKQLHILNTFKANYEQIIYHFIEECNRRISSAQRRLEKTPEENNRTTALMREVGEIEGAYQAAMAEVEQLGSEGKVEESMVQLTKAEALKAEKQEKERELTNLTETAGASGHQKLRVCDICGAYLSVLDSDRRLADHFGGKMHLGYHQLREMMAEWRTRGPLQTAPLPPPSSATNQNSANGHGPNGTAPVAAPAVAFRPIPPEKRLKQRGGGDRDRGRDERDRERESHRDGHRDSRDAGSESGSRRDRRGERGSSQIAMSDRDRERERERERDRERERERERERGGGRSSRTSGGDDYRSSRTSSSRKEDGGEERRSRSTRYDDDRRSSTRRTHDDANGPAADGDERDKRRRVD